MVIELPTTRKAPKIPIDVTLDREIKVSAMVDISQVELKVIIGAKARTVLTREACQCSKDLANASQAIKVFNTQKINASKYRKSRLRIVLTLA
jgi:hypothetical protein